MRTKHTTLQLGVSILAALVVIGACMLFFRIIKNKNMHTSGVVAALQDKIAKKENATSFLKRVSELEATKLAVESHLVDQTKIDDLVTYLENLGTEAKTSLAVKDISAVQNNKNALVIKISAFGNFSNVLTLVSLLENTPYQIHMTSVFLYKNNESIAPTDTKGKPKPPAASVWKVDVSFIIATS